MNQPDFEPDEFPPNRSSSDADPWHGLNDFDDETQHPPKPRQVPRNLPPGD